MIEEAKRAPSFSLPADDGTTFTLSRQKGGKVVVYFYPKDSTPGCTTEAQDFRDLQKEFEKANTVVVGISPDSIDSHCRFRDKQQLNFLLLSDPEREVLTAWGAFGEKTMYGKTVMGVIRSTVLIDEKGKVVRIWRKVRVKGHAQEVLDEAKR